VIFCRVLPYTRMVVRSHAKTDNRIPSLGATPPGPSLCFCSGPVTCIGLLRRLNIWSLGIRPCGLRTLALPQPQIPDAADQCGHHDQNQELFHKLTAVSIAATPRERRGLY
jgi:hypothetical protein